MTLISPTTRQRIIERVHTTGQYRAHHGGILMEIEAQQEPVSCKWLVSLKICIDRKWKTRPCATVFDAVEEFNRWMEYERYVRTNVGQEDLFS